MRRTVSYANWRKLADAVARRGPAERLRAIFSVLDELKTFGTQTRADAAENAIELICEERGWQTVLTEAIAANLEGVELHKCDNCGENWQEHQLYEPERLWERVDPGGVMPSGECPECGALCYPLVS